MKIIAESAANHQGDPEILKGMAIAAKRAGADYFTAQVFNMHGFSDPDYERWNIVEEIEFSEEEWKDIFTLCREIGMELIPCALDLPSLELCLSEGYELIKIHATDILNMPLLRRIAHSDAKVLLETQCASVRDIDRAVGVLGKERIVCILHGFSNYPTEGRDLNLNALDHMAETWGLPVGMADHTLDTEGVPLICLGKGAAFIEKHICLSRNDRNYDWQVSLEPDEFRMLTATVHKYSKTLGKGIKHPVASEVKFRNVLYKKYFQDADGVKALRSDKGMDFYDYEYSGFDKHKLVGTVIARLKSRRLHKKVFKQLGNDLMLFDLCARVSRARHLSKLVIATSDLEEDQPILEEADKRGIEAFAGDPLIVIDRMLAIAEKEKAWGVYRITGDNPFTDPALMDEMAEMFWKNDLDYVRVNNLPIGITAELYSVRYLMELYLHMEDPRGSEYLSWYVMLDKKGKKGAIEVDFRGMELSNYAFTVDFEEDFSRVQDTIRNIGVANFSDIRLEDILLRLDGIKQVDPKAPVKLPNYRTITFEEFIEMQKNLDYAVKETYKID